VAEIERDPGARSRQRQARDTVVAIEVEDTGAAFLQDRCLPFSILLYDQGDRSGTGLGLTVSRKILELHGGSIGLANIPGGGVRVRILLPA